MNQTALYSLDLIYLATSVTFIAGLKFMSNPATARRGNLIAAAGMALAVIATFCLYSSAENAHPRDPLKAALIFTALGLGSVIGWLGAKKVKMTALPQLVSLFNGTGGACAALIGLLEYGRHVGSYEDLATIMPGVIIGSVSLAGSIVAFLKLNGALPKPIRMPHYNLINNLVGALGQALGIATVLAYGNNHPALLYATFAAALLYGVLFVLPIGGADMPVVISLLNSFTGVAVGFGGFLYHNQAMLTGGILVGSAGTLLTIIMCHAMNRPLGKVIFGAFGGGGAAVAATAPAGEAVKSIAASDAAVLLNYSKKVIIVPGYGLAVAQAQHVIHDLETMLVARGIEVSYAIHPVAGRMPGHMNVLLAEANVDYGKLIEMEDVNPQFATTDVALIVGANDVVNPAAKNVPTSPIYGMPILEAENAAHIIINKRSMSAGYAGIDNDLFYNPKTSMLFGDAKAALTSVINELKRM